MNSKIKLGTKLVGEIEGNFYIPGYQRGYRWDETDVCRLLDDIYSTEGKKNYCLQPIVVKKKGDKYELIDGQQRLTTIYLIYHFMDKESSGFIGKSRFTLSYETRKESEEFLKSIDETKKDKNIDFWFMFTAYEAIKKWFSNKESGAVRAINKYFDEIVKVIWYEIDDSEDAIDLFTRLNIGKIPLTNAELVKAMFLSKDNNKNISREKQQGISLQWENMEKELHNDSLWYFLTNKESTDYQTRIDLVLDLISEKTVMSISSTNHLESSNIKPSETSVNNWETYYIFFRFNKMHQEIGLEIECIWRSIQKTFLCLKDWYEDHELYHKIGYLIASKRFTLQDIFGGSEDKTKEDFKAFLDSRIKDSIKIDNKSSYTELSYEKHGDREKMTALLLLFNVESVRRSDEYSQRFPFDKHKISSDGKVKWSLEHIHARHSEGLASQKEWYEWLNLHIQSVKSVSRDSGELVGEMNEAIDDKKLDRIKFEKIQKKVFDLFSEKGDAIYLHSIANIALLNSSHNSVLNKSTFDVKRNKIIEMDKKGQYIPFCTKMVFLKYYTESEDNQLHFWWLGDMEAYMKAIQDTLKDYLEKPIFYEKEGKPIAFREEK